MLEFAADSFFFLSLLVTLGFVLFGLDDLFVDLVALLRRLTPRSLSPEELERWDALPEKPIAVMIPAWDEGNLIEAMVRGNLARIRYGALHIFLGVYPNDLETCEAAARLEQEFPNVHAVVNSRPGPTSKGQMLNEAVTFIRSKERDLGLRFEVLLMQDAEDVIHPLAPRLVNSEASECDFLQFPVFSLPLSWRFLVGGIYMDEFAELHTKDLLVRTHLRAGVPSAGVGTALGRSLVEMLLEQRGAVFNEGSLTEDYELGLSSALAGSRSKFVAAHYRDESGRREYIATREYFPKKLRRSIRQKTRWNVGIVFQGWQHLGWRGGLAFRYFLYRDRKGIVANALSLLGYMTLLLGVALESLDVDVSARFQEEPIFWTAASFATLFFMLNRFVQRMVCTIRVYGLASALPLVLRWPLGVFINSMASLNATWQFFQSQVRNRALKWAKTEHEIPEFFVEEPSTRST